MVKMTTLKRPRQVIWQRKEITSNWLSNTLLSLSELVHSSFAQLLSAVSKLIHLVPGLKPLPRFICLCRLECYLIKVNAVRSAVFTFMAQRVRVAPGGTRWLFWSSLQHLTKAVEPQTTSLYQTQRDLLQVQPETHNTVFTLLFYVFVKMHETI